MRHVGIFFALLTALACSGPASRAPTAAPPSTAAPTIAALTRAPTPSPTAAPSPTLRYVAIGASDTVGVGASDPVSGAWPARVARLLPSGGAYVNVGVSGSVASQARTHQLPAAIAQRPTVVSIWLAVNDLNAQVTPAAYAGELGAIVDGLLSGTQAKVFVGNVPDLRPVPAYAQADKSALFALITAYNDAIARIAAKDPTRVVVVDLMTGSAALVSGMTVSQDGFHPSDAGYQLIADRFIAAMKSAAVPLR